MCETKFRSFPSLRIGGELIPEPMPALNLNIGAKVPVGYYNNCSVFKSGGHDFLGIYPEGQFHTGVTRKGLSFGVGFRYLNLGHGPMAVAGWGADLGIKYGRGKLDVEEEVKEKTFHHNGDYDYWNFDLTFFGTAFFSIYGGIGIRVESWPTGESDDGIQSKTGGTRVVPTMLIGVGIF